MYRIVTTFLCTRYGCPVNIALLTIIGGVGAINEPVATNCSPNVSHDPLLNIPSIVLLKNRTGRSFPMTVGPSHDAILVRPGCKYLSNLRRLFSLDGASGWLNTGRHSYRRLAHCTTRTSLLFITGPSSFSSSTGIVVIVQFNVVYLCSCFKREYTARGG